MEEPREEDESAVKILGFKTQATAPKCRGHVDRRVEPNIPNDLIGSFGVFMDASRNAFRLDILVEGEIIYSTRVILSLIEIVTDLAQK